MQISVKIYFSLPNKYIILFDLTSVKKTYIGKEANQVLFPWSLIKSAMQKSNSNMYVYILWHDLKNKS